MAVVSVTATPKRICNGVSLVQNLGPDALYVDVSTSPTDGPSPVLSSSNGVQVSSGEAVSFDNENLHVWGISGGTSDVRVLEGGNGIYGAAAASA